MPLITREPKRMCILENDSIVYYDACAKLPNAYDSSMYERLGRGVVYSIDGQLIETKEQLYFFVRRTPPTN